MVRFEVILNPREYGNKKESNQYINHDFTKTENWTISVESHLCSSKRFSKGTRQREVLQEIQMTNTELRTQSQDFEGRVICISMYNDIDWTKKDNVTICDQKSNGGV